MSRRSSASSSKSTQILSSKVSKDVVSKGLFTGTTEASSGSFLESDISAESWGGQTYFWSLLKFVKLVRFQLLGGIIIWVFTSWYSSSHAQIVLILPLLTEMVVATAFTHQAHVRCDAH
jgi:hypothetical protein